VVLKNANRWGLAWFGCLEAFISFEKAAGFSAQDSRLPAAKSRPQEFSEWFKIGRKTSGAVWEGFCSGDPDRFGSGWRMWWLDIQPKGRKEDVNGALLQDPNIDWTVLQKPGANGMFLVLIALLWWRTRLEGDVDGTSLPIWEDSVKDVTWVLGCLEHAYSRASDGSETSDVVKITTSGTKRK
jgi:hypothetical protein